MRVPREPDMAVRYGQFVLFGDSITQFAFDQEHGFAFGAQLANDYMRKLDIIDRGFSGYNTSQALRVISQSIPTPDVAKLRFVTIFLGANDACLPTSPSRQHIPLPTYTSNLHSLITHPSIISHSPSPHIILITPPPLNEHGLDSNGRLQRTAAHTKLYRDATLSVARETGVKVIDLWGVIMQGAGWKEGEPLLGSIDVERSAILDKMMYDGLHLDAEGYRVLHFELRKLIAREWPEDTPENLPDVLPLWDDSKTWEGKLPWE